LNTGKVGGDGLGEAGEVLGVLVEFNQVELDARLGGRWDVSLSLLFGAVGLANARRNGGSLGEGGCGSAG